MLYITYNSYPARPIDWHVGESINLPLFPCTIQADCDELKYIKRMNPFTNHDNFKRVQTFEHEEALAIVKQINKEYSKYD